MYDMNDSQDNDEEFMMDITDSHEITVPAQPVRQIRPEVRERQHEMPARAVITLILVAMAITFVASIFVARAMLKPPSDEYGYSGYQCYQLDDEVYHNELARRTMKLPDTIQDATRRAANAKAWQREKGC